MSSRLNFLKSLFIPLTTKKAIFIIVILGILVFFNGLFNNFVGDDFPQIAMNPLIRSIGNIPAFFTGSTFYYGIGQKLGGIYYKPLLNTTFSLTYTIFGPSYSAFHLFQIFLHILNVCILFLFLKTFFKKPIAMILSLIFLVHPVNSEAVFYISATQEVLFFFFGILALWILANFQSAKYIILAATLLLFSMLSKETGILFMLIALVYAFVYKKRKQSYSLLFFSTLTLAGYLLLRIKAVGILIEPSNVPIGKLDFLGRAMNMPAMLFFYLKTFTLPLNLASSYQWVYTQVTLDHLFLPLAIDLLFLSIISYFAIVLYKHYSHRYFTIYSFFGVWFLIGILFHLQIFPLDATVAERWFYFSIVGILGMIGVLLEAFHFDLINNWKIVCIAILLLLLSTRTIVRSFDWRNELTLIMHDVKVSKDDYVLENGTSFILLRQGRFEEAKTHAERSIKLYPDVTNYNILGLIYVNLGEYQKAKETYLKALEFGDYYLTYEYLASLALVSKNPKEYINLLKEGLKKFPKDPRILTPLAVIEYQLGNVNGAKTLISQAHTIEPSAEIVNIYDIIMKDLPLNIKVITK